VGTIVSRAASGRQTVVQQNSIEALHQNRNPLKQITGFSSLASIKCDSFSKISQELARRADALKTPKVSVAEM